MYEKTQPLIEITADVSYVVVSDVIVRFKCVNATEVSVDGSVLSRVPHMLDTWAWQVTQRAPTQLMTVMFPDGFHFVSIECIHGNHGRDIATQLYASLHAVDVRLGVGQSSWMSLHADVGAFEMALGMSVETFLRQILMLYTIESGVLRAWTGEPAHKLRTDYIAINDAHVVPMQQIHAHTPESETYFQKMQMILMFLQDIANPELRMLIVRCLQVIATPTLIHSGLVHLIDRATQAMVSAQMPRAYGGYQTADVALLFERWVWVTVLQTLGFSIEDIQSAITHGLSTRLRSNDGVWCGYQRRLIQIPASTGWSRDARVAIPDIMIWHSSDGISYSCLIIDAKFSLLHPVPSHDALNSCTAYLRRIGIGQSDPDAVVLVHPGIGYDVWPSGLIVVGTDGIDGTALQKAITAWCNSRIK